MRLGVAVPAVIPSSTALPILTYVREALFAKGGLGFREFAEEQLTGNWVGRRNFASRLSLWRVLN